MKDAKGIGRAMKDAKRIGRALLLAEELVSLEAVSTIVEAAEIASGAVASIGFIDFDQDNQEFYFEAYLEASGEHNTNCNLD